MAVMPGVEYKPLSTNYSNGYNANLGVLWHVQEGNGNVWDWLNNPSAQVSYHFVITLDGGIIQCLDTSLISWAAAAANPYYTMVVFEGWGSGDPTESQIVAAKKIWAWYVNESGHNPPNQVTDTPYGRGLGWHGMGGVEWGNHPYCPGESRKSRRGEAVAYAAGVTSTTTYVWPVESRFDITPGATWTDHVNRDYGTLSAADREWYYGLDFAADAGTPVFAIAAGSVTHSGWRDSYGYGVIIDHGSNVFSEYSHMQQQPSVSVGDTVRQGQQIGFVGSTGDSTGPHLDLKLWINSENVDPAKYLTRTTDWFDMATKQDLKDVIKEFFTSSEGKKTIQDAVLQATPDQTKDKLAPNGRNIGRLLSGEFIYTTVFRKRDGTFINLHDALAYITANTDNIGRLPSWVWGHHFRKDQSAGEALTAIEEGKKNV